MVVRLCRTTLRFAIVAVMRSPFRSSLIGRLTTAIENSASTCVSCREVVVRLCLPLIFGAVIAGLPIVSAVADAHVVLMLNRGETGVMVFEPDILRIQPGDTVRFVAEDKGHNSQSIEGMAPQGGISWDGAIDEEIEVTFETEGIYGYRCTPHYGMGMVGLIVVGDDMSNRSAAQEVPHLGKSQKMFERLFENLDAM
jgi:pseudoazurin